ncbi:MAG: TetR-like C-terminal domain-containing protein [Longicatena sp.]
MNIANNARRKASQKKIENAFIELIQDKKVEDVSITDICSIAKVNRSTFYANYVDIYDLVEKIRERMLNDFFLLYEDEMNHKYNSNDFLKLFQHIKENQMFYHTYFHLNFDLDYIITAYDTDAAKRYYNNEFIEYHMNFFRGGITSIIKMWLANGCDLSCEEMFRIIKTEYQMKV